MRVTYANLGHVGRLGNQLWQIASTVGIARAHGLEPVFPKWDYRPFFSLPDSWFGLTGEEKESTDFVDLDQRYATYLQDYSLFGDVEDEIREIFKPSRLALDYLEEYSWMTHDATSMHVRRGDNLRELNPATAGWHPLTPISYYADAYGMLGGPVIIFSDDAEWCQENLLPHMPDARVFQGIVRPDVPGGYWTAPVLDWIDLQLMARCERHCIANSSYSWWGAFLADKQQVIYPKCWYGKNLSYIPWNDMIPAHWTGLSC